MKRKLLNNPVKVLMSAINGYGYYYLKALRDEIPESKAILVGVVDPEAEKSLHYPWIVKNNIPVFGRMEDFFKAGHRADLTVISSPPQYHIEQAITALKHKSNVLIDKPVGIGKEAVNKLIKIARRKRRWIEVGYQWSYSSAIQDLKSDIINGVYGIPYEFKAICLWPRDHTYYKRNGWAGRKTDDAGRMVLDSPASNACAHFLHNLLFLCGKEMESSGSPAGLNSYKYRANQIENFDTLSLDMMTMESIQIWFYASHATENERNPEFFLRFTDGIVRYDDPKKGIIGIRKLGDFKYYGSPDDDHQFKKLFHSIDRVLSKKSAVCPAQAALSHAVIIDMLDSQKHPIEDINENKIIDDGKRRWVKGLNEIFNEAYDKEEMLYKYEL